MTRTRSALGALTAVALSAAVASGCGSSDSKDTSTQAGTAATTTSGGGATSAGASGDVLGTPKKATGKPLVFGMLNLESGPVTMPEVRVMAQAAIKYVNEYRGGINGRPIKLVTCVTDGQPSTSSRCAGQVTDKNPVAIIGGADTGSPGAFPIYQRKKLAYVGGVPFTPVESNAKDGVIFISLVVADNAAAVQYAKTKLGVKKAVVLQTADTQGKFTGSVIANEMKHAGMSVKTVNVAPSAADLSSPAAAALSSSPDLIYVEVPNACPAMLRALKAVGSTAKLMGIDPCTSPPALKAAGDAAEGLYFAQPFEPLSGPSKDAQLASAIISKYVPKDTAIDSPALASLGSVINLQAALSTISGDLNKESILDAFRSGSDHANFLAHPYTCDGNQVPSQSASCNSYQRIMQVKDGKVTAVGDDWVTGASLYKP
ncbi:MAG TPA: ABC transporter substrate-binding protein [Baekduia sp.]|nr:ABC transporter substrate-binding protein [Baekduia sp.]